eukprot:GHRR01008799.1.p1 GENE.GHRR01008799.1~~GHRR01008799.1.p1  ORF type:complete len:200 (+),score=45.70 GHRR01008799.1:650-1249(+)
MHVVRCGTICINKARMPQVRHRCVVVWSACSSQVQHKRLQGLLIMSHLLFGCSCGFATIVVMLQVKNSATRNLHRLAAAILFVKLLFERLLGRQCEVPANTNTADGVVRGVTLREAASSAYEVALAPFHTTIIKGVVRAGLLTLPSKEDFIEAIGEDEESAAVRAQEVVAACQDVHSAVNRLFVGINMPASSVWLWPSQ